MPDPLSTSVIDCLQNAVSLHLTAIEHYVTVAEHLGRIGYGKLSARFRSEADDEREHLSSVLARLEFFGVQPAYNHAPPAWPRYDVPGILTASLTLEQAAATAERQHVTESRAAGDEGSAVVFATLLAGSEESIRQIEADQMLIGQMGLDNWLSLQT